MFPNAGTTTGIGIALKSEYRNTSMGRIDPVSIPVDTSDTSWGGNRSKDGCAHALSAGRAVMRTAQALVRKPAFYIALEVVSYE